MEPRVVVITGASMGLGRALARELARAGDRLVLTARGAEALYAVAGETGAVALPGDVTDPAHARRLIETAVERFGGLDALVNNASFLGPSPQPTLEQYPLDVLERVYRVNVLAPLALIQAALPHMRRQGAGAIVNVTSDAGAEAYPGWGGYGSSKAALEHLSRVLAAELEDTAIRVYVVDPGDMNTRMNQEAHPGEDISHLPPPEGSAPGIVRLLDGTRPSGRYFARDLA